MNPQSPLDDDTLQVPQVGGGKPDLDERPFRVWVTPDAGVASLEPLRQRVIPRYPRRDDPLPQTVASAKRRARRLLNNHALKENLRVCVTLTYRAEPEDADADVDRFVEVASSWFPDKMHWAVVTVRSSEQEHRTHHHLLLPPSMDIHEIASSWPYGDVHVGFNPADDDVRRVVRYLASNFRKTAKGAKYFRRSKGSTVTTNRFDAGSRQEAELIVQSFVSRGYGGAYSWDPRCGGRLIVYWETRPTLDM